MNKVLALQKLEAASDTFDKKVDNSDYSATCNGNSCISYDCGGA